MSIPKRKPWICAENGCFTCEGKGICEVPENCAFAILHALELMELGLQERPRRWGKTHALMELAVKIMMAGCNVAIVFPDDNVRDIGRKLLQKVLGSGCRLTREGMAMGGSACWLETKYSFTRNVLGIDRMMILTDELKPEEVEELKKANKKHDFVLGYYTSGSTTAG
jgi:hypothetical protein